MVRRLTPADSGVLWAYRRRPSTWSAGMAISCAAARLSPTVPHIELALQGRGQQTSSDQMNQPALSSRSPSANKTPLTQLSSSRTTTARRTQADGDNFGWRQAIPNRQANLG